MAFGFWRFSGLELGPARARVEAALHAGLKLFDTADIYGPDNGEPFGAAEALLGRLIAEAPGLRDQFTLATKGGIRLGVPYDSRAEYLIAACEASLTRLNVERIDLYQVHRPDVLAHPAEVARALDRLRSDGKIAAAGVSNYTPAQTAALLAHLPFPLASVQNEFSALTPDPLQDGVLDQAMERRLAFLAWSPLAGGRVMAPGEDPRARAVAAALDGAAARWGVTRAAAAYAWVLAHPARPVVLVGSQSPERIREAAKALDVAFERAEWYAVLAAGRGAPLP